MFGLVRDEDFEMDEAKRTIMATGKRSGGRGRTRESRISAPVDRASWRITCSRLFAHFLFHLDKDYVIVDGEVKIVDASSRVASWRAVVTPRGLHQALEAKSTTCASAREPDACDHYAAELFPTVRKTFRHDGHGYDRRCRIRQIYKLPVVAIPSNKPQARIDENDLIYPHDGTLKFRAVADDVAERATRRVSRALSARSPSRAPNVFLACLTNEAYPMKP